MVADFPGRHDESEVMDAMVKSVILPVEQVQNYVRQQLARGDKLARFLAHAVQLKPGGFTFLPSNAAPMPADLGHGGVANSTGTALARERLVEFIADSFAADPRLAAVFEGDAISTAEQLKPGPKFIINVPSDVAIWRAPDFAHPVVAKSVYYVADSTSGSTDQIRRVLSSARGYPRIGVLTATGAGALGEGAEIADRALYELATNSQYLILGVFDEELDLIVPLSPVQS